VRGLPNNFIARLEKRLGEKRIALEDARWRTLGPALEARTTCATWFINTAGRYAVPSSQIVGIGGDNHSPVPRGVVVRT
jgi:hypothetical protein